MSKKSARILASILVIALLLPGVAMARSYGGTPHLYSSVSDYGHGYRDIKLEMSVRNAGRARDWEAQKLRYMVAQANWKIELLVLAAQLTPWNDVEWLQKKVDEIVAEVFAYADAIEATVVCVYTEYYIDGQYVLIDPLRVVNVRGGR